MNKRELNLKKYGISGKRYKELCGFCEQYPEWVDELKHKTDTVKSKVVTDMPLPPHGTSDQTGDLAIRRAELQKKCELIERSATQASPDLYQYIIKSVCYEVPVHYLISFEEMPIGKSAFYEMRRYFFYLLDINKEF
ncbi:MULTISPECIES: hypothetical protein [Blautia]|uniref:hypothetical protein n=1 Tax=Blautia TaxID=572511 RepID=UPI000CF1ED3B|nr:MULTISPECIES: hypothetical protein [Blautia]MDT4377285.1 hypothetical protein [Blautia coccoides]